MILPLELIERIMEYLLGDCENLLSCALTHSALYPRAKALLYTAIRVRSGSAHDSLRRFRFTADSCRYFERTERLALHEKHDSTLSPHTLSTFLLSFAGVPFPNLRYLELIGSESAVSSPWIHLSLQTFFCMTKTFASVEQLSLSDVEFLTLKDFMRLVCALPRLEELTLAGFLDIQKESSSIAVTKKTGSHLALRRIRLDFYTDHIEVWPMLCHWLIHTQSVREGILSGLVIDPHDWKKDTANWSKCSDGVAALLEHLGPALEDLSVVQIPSEPVLLNHNTDLRKLTLDFGSCIAPTDTMQVFTADSEGSLLRTLTSLKTPHLHTLVLHLHVQVPSRATLRPQVDSYLQGDPDAQVDWTLFNDMVARGRFDALQEVIMKIVYYTRRTFDIHGPEGDDLRWMHAAMEKAMQHLIWRKAGIMKLAYEVSYSY